jgi:PD-(D/E)XK nuclease superfamily
MSMETTTLDDQPKSFAFSFSRLKAFEDCPRRYYETQVLKDKWPEEKSQLLEWGDAVHKAMATALRTNTALPTEFKIFQPWIDKVARTRGEMLIEDQCQWACTREFKPTPWFAKNVWLRTQADAVKLDPPVALVVDWKTGKSLNGDPVQLILTSLMALLHFPDVHCVRSDFIWLQEDLQTTQVVYRNEARTYWIELLPRIKRLEQAVIDENFPPHPGRFCRRWCPVRSCEYWGK